MTSHSNTSSLLGKIILNIVVWGITGAILLVILLALLLFFKEPISKHLANYIVTEPTTYSPPEVKIVEQGEYEAHIVQTVAAANEAVVSIVATKDVPTFEQFYAQDPFFGLQPQLRENGTEEQEVSSGSGFIASADGLVVTNAHVVSDRTAEYSLFTNTDKEYIVEVLDADDQLDIAVLQITAVAADGDSSEQDVQELPDNFPYLEFADSDTIQLGQTAIAIGNALGEFRNSVSVGVVSGLSRSITASDGQGVSQLNQLIQTDTAINPGNSGGPLLNSQGQVIGVNVAVAQGTENIGFAVFGNTAQSILQSVDETGRIAKPFLGIRYSAVSEEIAEINDLDEAYGIVIVRGDTAEDFAVIPGSPADKAGLQENDIILEIDGEKITDTSTFSSTIRTYTVGETVELEILRKGATKTITVELEDRNKPNPEESEQDGN